jgi:hypothetical protein
MQASGYVAPKSATVIRQRSVRDEYKGHGTGCQGLQTQVNVTV